MKILFLTLARIDSLEDRGIYHDLLREFVNNGYDVTVVCPLERSNNSSTRVIRISNLTILQVKTLNIQKCNVIEKGFSMLSLNFLFKRAISKYFIDFKFDLILYSTPPITLVKLISWLKSKNRAKTYLLLKDIFPQNAVDMGYFNQNSLLHWYFSMVEKRLYQISDKIGCMSPANVHYLQKKYPNIKHKLEINPNCVDLKRIPIIKETKEKVRSLWNIPEESVVFIYGGNLGKPQGLDFLLDLISITKDKVCKSYFLIVGDGTEFKKLSNWFAKEKPVNAQLIKRIPKNEFDFLISSCDVGVIMLNKKFTIPNFPSRLLSFLENKLPVLALTDSISDVGSIAEEFEFGRFVEHGDLVGAVNCINMMCKYSNREREIMGLKGFEYLSKNFDVNLSFKLIEKTI